MRQRSLSEVLTGPEPEIEFENLYNYIPIEDRSKIRLFHLDAGERVDEITGHLEYASFTEGLDYEALSYTWESPSKKHTIATPEGVIPITSSLRSALVRLRLPDRTRVLWVDAICINQCHNEEKSHQILLMPLIYSAASRVLAYLGGEADGSESIISFLDRVANTHFGPENLTSIFMDSLESCGLPAQKAPEWLAFRKFWSRPWFGRIWIVQEFLLGKDVTMICGEWESPWETLFEAAKKISNHGVVYRSDPYGDALELELAKTGVEAMLFLSHFRTAGDCRKFEGGIESLLQPGGNGDTLGEIMNIPAFRAIRSMQISNVGPSNTSNMENFRRILGTQTEGERARTFIGLGLKELIQHSKRCKATDARDRFFALLSLVNDLNSEELEILRPDYGKPLEWVACRYASVLIKKGKGMDMLYDTCVAPGRSGFPSWLADWATDDLSASNVFSLGVNQKNLYNAGGDTIANVVVMPDSDVLATYGSHVDSITQLGSGAILQPETGPSYPMVANLMLTEADCMFSLLTSYPTGESIAQVQWRTLIANKTATTNKVPSPVYGAQYRLWREHIKDMYFAPTPEHRMAMSPPPMLDYFQSLVAVSEYKLCVTKIGLVGLVPLATKTGDVIAIFLGGRVPFVLRPSPERPGMFTLVGGCYIHGIMNGEAKQMLGWKEFIIAIH